MSVSYGGDSITFADGSVQSGGWTGMRNRIINGAMVIDQRNAGASVTPVDGTYTLDRWVCGLSQASKFTVQQTPSASETGSATRIAAGFSNYLACTVGASASVTLGASDVFAIHQKIEGFNFNDMAWGTASAKAVTLSFLAYSSVTGTFGGAIVNSANNRSYPFTYSIPTANTWTTISVTIPGDTTGTWIGATNGIGAKIWFSLGTGSSGSNTAGAWIGANSYSATGAVSPITTNSATFYITGVQLERGSTASSFEYRSFGAELALCQRYFEKSYDTFSPVPTNTTLGNHVGIVDTQSLTAIAANIRFRVEKRTNPTMNFYKYETTAGVWARNSDNASTGTITTPWGMGSTGVGRLDSSTSLTSGAMYHGQWSATAEL